MDLLTLLERAPGMDRNGDFPPVLCLTGGGGKTTVIYALARLAAARGLRVLITTTTMMIDPRKDPGARYDRLFFTDAMPRPPGGTVTFAAGGEVEGFPKVRGPEEAAIRALAPDYDIVLAECDGAKHRPVKAPADHEPVVPRFCGALIGVIGLDCLGRAMDGDTVHRPERFAEVTGCRSGEPVEARHLFRLAASPSGIFKSAPPGASRILLFNKAELLGEKRGAVTASIAKLFRESAPAADMLIFGSAVLENGGWEPVFLRE